MLTDSNGATRSRREQSRQEPSRQEQLFQCHDRLATSLLRYLREASPWVDDRHAEVIQELRSQANDQDESLALVADLLFERNWVPASPAWPEEYPSLQYLSLRFLWDRLLEDQQEIVALLDDVLAQGGDDAESPMIANVRTRETERLEALRQINLTF